MEVLPNIYCFPMDIITLPPHSSTNCFIIAENDSAFIIDAVCRNTDTISNIFEKIGIKKVQTAAITHPHIDHFYGLNKILKKFGGNPLYHINAQSKLNHLFDNKNRQLYVTGEEDIKVAQYNIKVIYTPGHSPDHLCLYLKKEKLLFSGDTILGWGTSIISPPDGDMKAYMKTLENLDSLDIDIICPAHGPVIRENGSEWIKWYIKHRQMREKKVLKALRLSALTPMEIAEQIYNDQDIQMHGPGLLARAERSVMAHLEKLEKEGIVVLKMINGHAKYTLLENSE